MQSTRLINKHDQNENLQSTLEYNFDYQILGWLEAA